MVTLTLPPESTGSSEAETTGDAESVDVCIAIFFFFLGWSPRWVNYIYNMILIISAINGYAHAPTPSGNYWGWNHRSSVRQYSGLCPRKCLCGAMPSAEDSADSDLGPLVSSRLRAAHKWWGVYQGCTQNDGKKLVYLIYKKILQA